MPDRGRTIREAIGVALEAVPGDPREWTADEIRRTALRQHVLRWVSDYALHRGVVLTCRDLSDEIDAVIAGLSGVGQAGAPAVSTSPHSGRD